MNATQRPTTSDSSPIHSTAELDVDGHDTHKGATVAIPALDQLVEAIETIEQALERLAIVTESPLSVLQCTECAMTTSATR